LFCCHAMESDFWLPVDIYFLDLAMNVDWLRILSSWKIRGFKFQNGICSVYF
jgi:hypothetical protein